MQRNLMLCVAVSLLAGMLLAWLLTPYATGSIPMGWVVHPLCCFIYSLQLVSLALFWHWSTNFRCVYRLFGLVAIAVLVEMIQANFFSPVWIVTHPVLFIARTPMAQWGSWLPPFGLSAMLYLAFFCGIVRLDAKGWRRWLGASIGLGILVLLWLGGILIESHTPVKEMSFRAALVQPHLRDNRISSWEPWRDLIRLTDHALSCDNNIDLVVWPECMLTASTRQLVNGRIGEVGCDTPQSQVIVAEAALKTFDVGTLAQKYSMAATTSLLVGSVLSDEVTTERYGLQVALPRRMNCACLVTYCEFKRKATLAVYEKQALMPLVEYVPAWLQNSLGQKWASAHLNSSDLTASHEFRLLAFTDSQGAERLIGVAICYESWLPWLPQYHTDKPLDAICHLVYDGDFANSPKYTERMLDTIRLRAIETRTWQLVCSCWAGTAIIDPRGKVLQQLTNAPGVLLSTLGSTSESAQSQAQTVSQGEESCR